MQDFAFNPERLIQEVKKRPGLYRVGSHALDRDEKLVLWKEIGAALCHDWDTYDKATAYDRVLQLQKKWRSLRDAYNRELRSRRSGVRIHQRVYMYFKAMSFLGGFDGDVSEDDNEDAEEPRSETLEEEEVEEKVDPQPVKRRKRKIKKSSSDYNPTEEVEMPIFPLEPNEEDSDKLFLMSFLPEMRQFPVDIKMWVRAQIANIMQEAVTTHLSKAGGSREVKRSTRSSFD